MRAPAVVILLAAACGGTSHETSVDAGAIDLTYVPSGYTKSTFLSDAPVRSFTAAGIGAEAGKHYEIVMLTDQGRLVLDLLEADTPLTVNSMVWLARHHFYDGIAFHRVIDGFVAQGGDPNTLSSDTSTWGTGDPGYSFVDEFKATLTYDGAGVLGMANSGPNTNGSQFFITLSTQHQLDGGYTIFGHLVEGDAVMQAIARGEPPATPTRIVAAYAVEQ